jgi:hypothetical protein
VSVFSVWPQTLGHEGIFSASVYQAEDKGSISDIMNHDIDWSAGLSSHWPV